MPFLCVYVCVCVDSASSKSSESLCSTSSNNSRTRILHRRTHSGFVSLALPSSSDVRQRVLSARQHRFRTLQNKLNEVQQENAVCGHAISVRPRYGTAKASQLNKPLPPPSPPPHTHTESAQREPAAQDAAQAAGQCARQIRTVERRSAAIAACTRSRAARLANKVADFDGAAPGAEQAHHP